MAAVRSNGANGPFQGAASTLRPRAESAAARLASLALSPGHVAHVTSTIGPAMSGASVAGRRASGTRYHRRVARTRRTHGDVRGGARGLVGGLGVEEGAADAARPR